MGRSTSIRATKRHQILTLLTHGGQGIKEVAAFQGVSVSTCDKILRAAGYRRYLLSKDEWAAVGKFRNDERWKLA